MPIEQENAEGMESSAVDFLLRNVENLKLFLKKMEEDFEQKDLAFMLKMFVLNENKVFDMPSFMKKQSELAEEYVKEYGKDITPEERRNMLNQWVEENAAIFRKHTMFKQMRCIEKSSAKIIPIIEKALKE